MKQYKNKIQLVKNYRGVWELDTFKGCSYGNNGGCYGICYAAKLAKARGYNFTNVIKREFINQNHFYEIANKLIKIPFIRIGVMCDPSYNWEHTLDIIDKIKPYNKNIVVITKHWNELKDNQLYRLKGLVINTSISALDTKEQREKRLFWYNKLKLYCKKSVLRVNTCKFYDLELKSIQDNLLNKDNIIDNVLRFPKNNTLVKKGIIELKKYKYLQSFAYASKNNPDTYFGFCNNCLDQCGIISTQKKLINFI